MLTRDECEKALDCLADDDKMDELAQKFSMDDDYTSHVNYEIARKWCYDQLKECINDRFEKGNVFVNVTIDEEKLKEIVDERIYEYFRGID